MTEEIEITSKQEVLIEAANKLYASDIVTSKEYSILIDRIASIKE